jgi:hypothetical protein
VRGLLLAFVLVACGSGPKTKECVDPVGVQEFNDANACLGPLISAPGLLRCEDPSQAQGHGLITICVVDVQDKLYRVRMSTTEWVEGDGWTHSTDTAGASTLSAANEVRCSAALPDAVPACQ